MMPMVQLIRAAALAVVALAASTGAMPIRGANGVLYGISQSSPCGTPPTSCNSLVSIDEDSGVQTPIGQKFPGLDAQELSTIDSKRNIYYGIFLNMTTKAPTVVGLAIGSGNVVLVRELQLSEMVFVGVGQHIQCDPGSGFLIISGADGKTGHKVVLLDPATPELAAVEIYHVTAPAIAILGGDATFDTDLGVFYFANASAAEAARYAVDAAESWSRPPLQVKQQLEGEYAVVDVERRKLRQGPPPPPPGPPPPYEVDIVAVYALPGVKQGISKVIRQNSQFYNHPEANFNTMDYDSQTKSIRGMGFVVVGSPPALMRIVNSYTPATAAWKLVGNVPGYAQEMGQLSSIDPASRSLFALIAASTEAKPPFQFSLIHRNLDTAADLCPGGKCPILCGGPKMCPWSIEALHKSSPPRPVDPCHGKLKTKAACDADARCDWCVLRLVRVATGACYTLKDAKGLPVGAFSCDPKK